jgi:hypothetical protein
MPNNVNIMAKALSYDVWSLLAISKTRYQRYI